MRKLKDFHLGMSCTIETFNGQYIALSLLPIATNSICYGSNTEGIHVISKNEEIKDSIQRLMQQLNYKEHKIIQQGDTELNINLPYNLQIHKYNKDRNIYFINKPLQLLIKLNDGTYLRSEMTSNYSSSEIDPSYERQTWKNPVKCSECENYIADYEYYAYDSLKNMKLSKAFYYCCFGCYKKLISSKCFKVSFYKIMHCILPLSLRCTYWRNKNTGEVSYEIPLNKIPLNPDAFTPLHPADNKKDKKLITSLISKLKEKVLDDFINELDANKESPLVNAEELAILAHKRGINIRLLGKLTFRPTCNYIREIAVILILSRAIKKLVLDALNNIGITQDPKDVVMFYLNHLLTLVENVNTTRLWERLTEYVCSHWSVMVDKSSLLRLHIPTLVIAICKQLNINLQHVFNSNYNSLVAFNKDDLIMVPLVIGKSYDALSLEVLLVRAEELDKEGKRTQWNLKGGPEREKATEYFNLAIRLAIKIYKRNSLKYADVALAFAKHLQSLHEESGNPINSKWNRSARITPSKNSETAIYFFEEAIKIYEADGTTFTNLLQALQSLARIISTKNVIP